MGLADRSSFWSDWNRIDVSILVLMDGARRQWKPPKSEHHVDSFNPCFDGWGSPTSLYGRRRDAFPQVSILVLMDGARRHTTSSEYVRTHCGFNPCFDGWGSPTSQKFLETIVLTCFNPCFDGWGSPTSSSFARSVIDRLRFQSLF